jgi:outer membrane receptor for ferrienterochelin and colicin
MLLTLLLPPALASKTGKLSGVIFTVGQGQVQTVWPNARVTLKNLTTHAEVSTVSNDVGAYSFSGIPLGDYQVTVALAGFETITKRLTIKEGSASQLDFQLLLKKQTETVTVTAEPTGVDLSSSSGGTPTLTADILKSAVRLGRDFQEALPLLPGVVRGPDGLIRIKGGRTNQTNTLVNTASVADPFTGQPALRLPIVALQSVRVLSNPFSSEYGKFSSGVVEVNTRGGTDDWKWLFEDPIPRFRWIDYGTHGVESASPHLTFAGPIKRGKLYLFQSLAYGYDTVRTPSLPDPNNVRVVESFNTYTQLDWNLKPDQQLSMSLTTDPQDSDFANIDTFNPQPVTANYHQRGFFTSARHRWILASGGFLQSLFAAKRLDAQVFPARDVAVEMVLFPEQNSGSFFEQQDRRTRLYQWSQSLHLWPLQSVGRHLLAFGYSYERSSYRGAGCQSSGHRVARRWHTQQPYQLRRSSSFSGYKEPVRFLRAGQLADSPAVYD